MKIEAWTLDRIRPYENNPRLNDDAVDAVSRSIEQFGFRQPIVVDADGGGRPRRARRCTRTAAGCVAIEANVYCDSAANCWSAPSRTTWTRAECVTVICAVDRTFSNDC